MSTSLFEAKNLICDVGSRLYKRGLITGGEGNISFRFQNGEILTTPSGVCKGYLEPHMLITVDRAGEQVRGEGKPSSELPMHLQIYKQRPDINAVVHAHPPNSTAFAVAGIPLAQCVTPEIVLTLGAIPLTPYGTPSTDQIPRMIAPVVEKANAFLLANHGAVTLGRDLLEAYYRMESVEHYAGILIRARILGGVNLLSREQVEELKTIRHRFGADFTGPDCETCQS